MPLSSGGMGILIEGLIDFGQPGFIERTRYGLQA